MLCAGRSKHIIVHRDLKPANLMLGGIPHETGTREMAAREGNVKIADFGLSRSLAIQQQNKRGSISDLTKLVCPLNRRLLGRLCSHTLCGPCAVKVGVSA